MVDDNEGTVFSLCPVTLGRIRILTKSCKIESDCNTNTSLLLASPLSPQTSWPEVTRNLQISAVGKPGAQGHNTQQSRRHWPRSRTGSSVLMSCLVSRVDMRRELGVFGSQTLIRCCLPILFPLFASPHDDHLPQASKKTTIPRYPLVDKVSCCLHAIALQVADTRRMQPVKLQAVDKLTARAGATIS